MALDTRDLQEEIDELESDLEDDEDQIDQESHERLLRLRALSDEVEGWIYGVQLIPDEEFEDHAREVADQLGILEGMDSWPFTCIDWERAAADLQTDYSCVTFEGTNYYYRA